jgi:cation:H+ antiporter
VIAATFLSKYADAIAELTGLGRLLIGSVLLAGATSLPELTVDISAVRLGAVDLAVGDLLGSSLMNLLILSLLDLSRHSRGRMFSKQAAAHALSGSVSAALTCMVALALFTNESLGPYAILGMSPAAFLIAAAYMLGVRLVYIDQRIAQRSSEGNEQFRSHVSLKAAVAGFAASALAILLAGPFLAAAADQLAEVTGLGGTFVGTSLVAFSTSLPEMVSSLAALRLGAYDLAIGNIFGSNALNMVLIVPLDIVYPGPILAAVSVRHAFTCMAAVLATLVAIMGQLYQAESRIRFLEPDAGIIILIVIAALTVVFFSG